MPAKELTPEQKADAERLLAHFKRWQDARRAAREPASQERRKHPVLIEGSDE